jgi:glycerol kinase
LLEAFRIPRAILPDCRANRGDWATLRIGDWRVPLTVVTGDQSAVPYAFETPRIGDAFLTLGTGAFVQQVDGATPTSSPGLLNSVLWQDGDQIQYALEGTVNGAGAALTWLADIEQADENELLSALPGWLASAVDPPIFANAIGGLAAPFWKAHATSEFVGARDLAGRAVAVIESIAFLLQANLDAMRDGGRPVRKLVAVGGLSRFDGLLERIASLAGVPVLRAAHGEATAYGVARLLQPAMPPLAADQRFDPDAQIRAGLVSRYLRCLEWWRSH